MPNLRQLLWAHLVLCLSIAAPRAMGQASYFPQAIDYWGSAHLAPAAKSAAPAANGEFDWQPYLDPAQEEFFREGDYLPPKPFMAVARDPSDENLERWFAYMGAKNAVSTRLERRMQDYMKKRSVDAASSQIDQPASSASGSTAKVSEVDPKRFALRFFFESTCPHCRRMAPEIDKLRATGFQVIGYQVDHAPQSDMVHVPVKSASAAELEHYGIQSVPTLLVADLASKTVFRLSGYQTAEHIVELLQSKP